VPEGLFKGDFAGLLSDAARELMDGGKNPGGETKKRIAARLACHASVRGAEDLSQAELERLMEELSRAEDPAHCPHGRPTTVAFDMEGLKRLFKRK
jgi:DNA mismatch repair protein MutL